MQDLDTTIKCRLPQELKALFKEKSELEYGSMSRCLIRFIESYSQGTFFADEKYIGLLYMAVQALYSYTNNLNQVVKKLHAKGELDERFTPEFVQNISLEVDRVIRAFTMAVRNETVILNSEMKKRETQK